MLARTCSRVDWRTYTYASRARCDAVIFSPEIASTGPSARSVTAALLPGGRRLAITSHHAAGDDPGQQRQHLGAGLLGQPMPLPRRRPGLAGEQGELAGRRYPQNAHGFTSPKVVGAIRDEVNLFASSRPGTGNPASRFAPARQHHHQFPQPPPPRRIQHHRWAIGLHRPKHVRRCRGDRSRRAIRQLDHQQQHAIQPLERPGSHQPPRQRVRRRDDPHLTRQHRPKMLQSVAISVGTGKTHIAQALGHLAIRHGAETRFLKTSRALAHLAGGHADLTWDKRLRELTRPAVLILDDCGMRELTPGQADDLYELITERSGRSLILTSNRAPADWYPLFPNPVVAESLPDRLINTSHQVFMNGPSYRPNKRPGRVVPTGKEDIR